MAHGSRRFRTHRVLAPLLPQLTIVNRRLRSDVLEKVVSAELSKMSACLINGKRGIHGFIRNPSGVFGKPGSVRTIPKFRSMQKGGLSSLDFLEVVCSELVELLCHRRGISGGRGGPVVVLEGGRKRAGPWARR